MIKKILAWIGVVILGLIGLNALFTVLLTIPTLKVNPSFALGYIIGGVIALFLVYLGIKTLLKKVIYKRRN